MSDIQLILRRCKRGNEIKLDLSFKQITILPSDIYSLSQLEVLDLSNNKLNALDPKISQLSTLKVLNIANNNIISLPNSLLQMKNLQFLNCSGNPLSNQFDKLLIDENQINPQLKSILAQCFGEEENSSKGNLWFNDTSSTSNTGFNRLGSSGNNSSSNSGGFGNTFYGGSNSSNSNTFGQTNNANIMSQLVEKDNQLSQQKKKIQELEQELQKLSFSQGKNIQGQGGLIKVLPLLDPVQEIEFKDLEIRDAISQGGFSIVHKGKYKGCDVAIKKIFNPNITQDVLDEINNEVNMLATLRHPNIILLMGIVSQPQNMCIVTDLVEGGDLFTYLHKQRKDLSGVQKAFIVKQIINAFYYLHSHQIVHRDLKSYNILLDVGFKIKLCDFGLARKYSDLNQGNSKFSGTPTYMAPELFQKKGYDEKVDVFAFGTLLWEIYAQEVPFDGLEPNDIMARVTNDEQLPQKQTINSNIYKLIVKCRALNPNLRPSFEKIYQEFNQLA
ncbi:hypothetical protein ABPG74_021480 [Tetrahymena malaccensis]